MRAEERYWAKIDRRGPGECWPWTAATNFRGYGLFYGGGKMRIATRWGWELLNGDIPDGMFVCHTCDTPACMNPGHWFLGSHADNMADCVAKGRTARGDANGARRHPDRLARGDSNGRNRHPDRYPVGDEHYARARPEKLPRGESHGRSRLTESIVRDVRQRHAAGVPTCKLAAEHGVATSTIRRVVAGTAWQHIE